MVGKIRHATFDFRCDSALQGWADFHGRDVSLPNDSARFSFDGETRFVSGTMQSKSFTAIQRVPTRSSLEGSVPVFARPHEAPPERDTFSFNVISRHSSWRGFRDFSRATCFAMEF